MHFTEELFPGMADPGSDLNHSLRLRFETLSKLASEIGEKNDFAGVQLVLNTNMKYLMEAYGYALLYQKGEDVCAFSSFPRETEIIEDADHACVKLGQAMKAMGRPGLFRRAEIDQMPEFAETNFRKPKIQAVMSYPLEVDHETSVTLVVANKNHSEYFPVDYKFSRFVLRIAANKLEQLFSKRALQKSMAEKQELVDKLRFQKEFSEKVLFSIGDGLVVTDYEGRIRQLNPALLALTGWDALEIAGKDLFSILTLNAEESELPPLEAARAGSLKNAFGLIRCASEEEVPVRFSCSPISVDTRGMKGIVVSVNDIRAQVTADRQRKEAELAMAVANTERKRAEELSRLNEELDRFVYIASHDLRAPLTSILGLISILESPDIDATAQKTYLGLMNRSVRRLDTFIRNIVDYSRNSRVEVVSEPVDLQKEVSEIIDGLSYIQGFQTIDFRLELERPRIIQSDQTRLRIILNNFLSNAVKYHDYQKEKPYVRISAAELEAGVRLEIEDNGTGIPEAHHAKLFDMFFRATPNGDGSGIGLYIVNEMLKKLGGTVSFTSEPGRGSTFRIELPSLRTAEG